jgi:AraC-like DNA-binding protein
MPIEMVIDGKRFITKPNACIFSKPKSPRGFYFVEDTTMNWIHAYAEIEPLLEKYNIPLDTVFYPKSTGFISDLFRKMKVEMQTQEPYYEELLDSYVIQFLTMLSRAIHTEQRPELSSADQNKLYRIRWQVLSSAEEKWTVEKMAEMVSLSPSRFHAVYKSLFGSSPMQDVIRAKMDLAKTILLLESKPTLAEVAERLGYKNAQHFIAQFKAATGMTPGAYRKNNR